MSERELRAGLAVAVADEPPMFDVEVVVRRGRRAVGRRRLAMACGAAVTMVAVTMVVVPVLARSMPADGAPVAAFPAPPDPADPGQIAARVLRGALPAGTAVAAEPPRETADGRRWVLRFRVDGAQGRVEVDVRREVEPVSSCGPAGCFQAATAPGRPPAVRVDGELPSTVDAEVLSTIADAVARR